MQRVQPESRGRTQDALEAHRGFRCDPTLAIDDLVEPARRDAQVPCEYRLRDFHLQGIEIGKLSGLFFFVWTLLALAVVSLLSLTASAQGLWSLLRSK